MSSGDANVKDMNEADHRYAGTKILVKGGRTGAKLHLATVGSSSLSCGHWTRADISAFFVSDDLSEENLILQKARLCEKCFPQYAEKAAAYSGPKIHLNHLTPFLKAGKVFLRNRKDKSACGRRPYRAYSFGEFKAILADRPERACSRCLARFEELKAEAAKLRNR